VQHNHPDASQTHKTCVLTGSRRLRADPSANPGTAAGYAPG